jgi:hypothetical protein
MCSPAFAQQSGDQVPQEHRRGGALPDASRGAISRLMRQGLFFRYAETGEDAPESALLEAEFAAYTDARYCVAVIFCGGSRR